MQTQRCLSMLFSQKTALQNHLLNNTKLLAKPMIVKYLCMQYETYKV